MQGWPRDLSLRPVAGVDRTGDPDSEVREAIAVERRVQSAALPVRVEAVAVLDDEQNLFRARLTLGAQRGRAVDWRGARLAADLVHGGRVWQAELLDLDGQVAILAAEPGVRPAPGMVDLRPFDFLRAPHALVTRRSLEGVRPRYVELLEASAGWRAGRLMTSSLIPATVAVDWPRG